MAKTAKNATAPWDGESVVCDACYIAEGMPANNANPGLVVGGKGTPGR